MRIAQCSDTFLPVNSDVERTIYEYARVLGELGHESYVIAPMGDTGYRAKYPFEIIDFQSVRMPGLSGFRTGVAAMDRHYIARMEYVGLDVVHAHSPGFSGLEAARLADTRHIPLIGTYHGGYFEELLRSVKGEALIPLAIKYVVDFYSRCDEVWAANEAARSELISYGYEGNIELVPCGAYPSGLSGAQSDTLISWESVIETVLSRYAAITELERFRLTRKRGLFRKELTAADRSLEKRKAALLQRFLKQDMQQIYSYGYTKQHEVIYGESTTLPRADPHLMGVSPRDLLGFFHAVDSDTEAGVQSMLVLRHGHVIAEGYWSPYHKKYPHLLFSMSKSITSTAVGLLVDEKKLMLSEKVVDLFKEKVDNPQNHPMKDVTVWHLLTMSTGVRFDEIGTALGTDWVREFLDSGVKFEPGTQFYYNSMNTYMLAAIVVKKAGVSMMEYLNARLFWPLGIYTATWECCPQGVEKGGWGLSLTLEDAAKIGQMYLNKGTWNGRRILSEEWIEQATSKQIETPNGECTDGYGYQIWMAPQEGAYLFNGAFGQYVLMMPKSDTIVSVFSGSARLFAKGGLMAQAERCFINAADSPLEPNDAERHALDGALSSLTGMHKQNVPNLIPMSISWLASQVSGKYEFSENISGIMPFVLSCLHNAFSEGITSVELSVSGAGEPNPGESLAIRFRELAGGMEYENTLYVGDGVFIDSVIRIREEVHPVSVGAVCGLTNEGAAVLRLYVYFLTTPCTRVVTLKFEGEVVHAEFDELPTASNAALMLLDLAGITKTQLFRTIMPMLKRDSLQQQFRDFAVMTADGVKRDV